MSLLLQGRCDVRFLRVAAIAVLGLGLPVSVAAQDFGVMNSAETINKGNFKLMANPIVIFGKNGSDGETGIAVMEVIRGEELQQHALETGNYLLEGLEKLKGKHGMIGDVRGKGLFVGAELVRNRESLEPAVPEIDEIVEAMKERGFLLSTDGPLHNVLKIKPPMVFNKENASAFLQNLDEVLEEWRTVQPLD